MHVTGVIVETAPGQARPNPPRDALQTLSGGGSVRVRVDTDAGVCGSGEMSFGRVTAAASSLAVFIEQVLAPVVIGTEVECVRGTHSAMRRETEYHGTFGFASFGIAAIDTALWDCLGRALQVPCWHLWGRATKRIRAYAMVGWMNYSDSEVQDICRRAVDQGFRAVKIKVGYPSLRQDVARIERVREAVGDGVDIMVDANQSLTVAEAIRRGRAFDELGCLWWEEPIPAADLDGYRELTRSLDIPVATGENLYTVEDFARFLRHDAVDVVQADLRRAGGPTALLAVGTMASAFGRRYASHGGGPVQLNVMACLDNAMYLETGLIGPDSPLGLKDGFVTVPDGPGFSFG